LKLVSIALVIPKIVKVNCLQIFVSEAAIQYEPHPTERRKDIALALACHANAKRTELPRKCSAKVLKLLADIPIESISLKCSIRNEAEIQIL
jgi:hypothetical protein